MRPLNALQFCQCVQRVSNGKGKIMRAPTKKPRFQLLQMQLIENFLLLRQQLVHNYDNAKPETYRYRWRLTWWIGGNQ